MIQSKSHTPRQRCRIRTVMLRAVVICSVFIFPCTSFSSPPPSASIAHFEKQIRPILVARCFECHGPEKQESGLRLDSRAAVLKGGDRGEIAKAGEGAASLLVHALKYDEDLRMPPNGRLTAQQVEAFSAWVDQGLPWPDEPAGSAMSLAWKSHWAFQPVVKPAVPEIANDRWSALPVDRFILEQLQTAKIGHADFADRRTLIRRATFDLTGLPPTAEEVDDFAADQSPDAFERLLDRLLASPRYGERWARHWLDIARYADNKGYVFFEEQSYPWAYTYRDYVIRSLNEDKPYDRFVLEQLAADQLDRQGDDRSLTAMGYLTVGGHFMGNVHDIVDDRIDVVTRGLLGLTVTCARCHDHKYDPVSAADYYALYGVFRSTTEPLVPPVFDTPANTPEYQTFLTELATKQKNLDDFIHAKHSALVEGARTRIAEYLLAARTASLQPSMDDFMLIADPDDVNPAMIVRYQSYLEKLAESAKKSDSKSGESKTLQDSLRVWNPWLTLSVVPEDRFAEEVAQYATQANSSGPAPVNSAIFNAVFASPLPTTVNELAQRYGNLMKSVHLEWQTLLREVTAANQPLPDELIDPDKEEIRREMYAEQTPANLPKVFGWGFLSLLPDRASQGEYQKVLKEVEKWIMTGAGAPPRAMVLQDAEMYEPRVFQRGNPNRPGESVSRRYLASFSDGKPFAKGSGRLELAEAIVASNNPLTSRVMVNRLWQAHFGTGLVRTSNDFGLRSDPPTHPELLDWLATEFTCSSNAATDADDQASSASPHRYSLKRQHRLLMSSSTYRQSCMSADESVDPENRLWGRANRRRLDFESTRDALLSTTGKLEDRIGGPSQNLLEGFQPRRTLYLFINRLDLPGLLSVFDFPSPAATSGQRDTTTISPQALFLMNGPLTSAVADAVYNRSDVAAAKSSADRVALLYRILFQRQPTEEERRLAVEFVANDESAIKWSELIQALLVTNEFVFVD